MKPFTLVALSLSSATAVMAATTKTAESTAKGVPVPSQLPKVGEVRSQGCWGAKGSGWELIPTLDYPSGGSCTGACKSDNYTVASTHAEECWCGANYPPTDTYADDSKCNYPCPGYDLEACGAIGSPGYYSVYNTGIKADVPNAEEASSTTSGVTATSTNAQGETIIVTQPASSDSGESSGGGSNAVGIAVGVVVGLVLLAAALGAGYFWMRKKRRQEEAEERRRADAVSAFVGGSKPSSISGSFADSRLDPVMAHRRMSDGSIADNHDYSRKILRVTNA